jgi:hypothetical protein
MGERADFCRRLHTGTFFPWLANHFDRNLTQFLNHDRIEATVGSAERQKALDMGCSICRSLAQAFEAGRSEYIEARSSACYQVSKTLAAKKNVDMERARYELEEHRLVCVSAARVLARLPKPDVATSLGQLAA